MLLIHRKIFESHSLTITSFINTSPQQQGIFTQHSIESNLYRYFVNTPTTTSPLQLHNHKSKNGFITKLLHLLSPKGRKTQKEQQKQERKSATSNTLPHDHHTHRSQSTSHNARELAPNNPNLRFLLSNIKNNNDKSRQNTRLDKNLSLTYKFPRSKHNHHQQTRASNRSNIIRTSNPL